MSDSRTTDQLVAAIRRGFKTFDESRPTAEFALQSLRFRCREVEAALIETAEDEGFTKSQLEDWLESRRAVCTYPECVGWDGECVASRPCRPNASPGLGPKTVQSGAHRVSKPSTHSVGRLDLTPGAALSSEDATRPTGDSKSGPEDGQSDTAPMKRPVMEGVDPAATDSGHVGASTYVWLIERGHAEHQEPTAWVTKAGPIAWTTNAYAAIRFQTREAAQAFIAEHLTHPTRGPSARAVQHGFARPTGDKQ